MHSPHILVLGGDGMLGHVLVRDLQAAGLDVACTVRSDGYDATQPDKIRTLVTRGRYRVAINAIGLIKQRDPSPADAITVNAVFPHQLADWCAAAGTHLIHVSTDCVFSGELSYTYRYTEEHRTDATDLYGRSKALGEVDRPGVLTLRTSLIGLELHRKLGLIEWFLRQNPAAVPGYTQHWFSGVTCREFARIVGNILAHEGPYGGIYQLASEKITKHDLLAQLAAKLPASQRPAVTKLSTSCLNRALSGKRLQQRAPWTKTRSWDAMLTELANDITARASCNIS